jgi:release factor glutamine methyltransferase
MKQNDWPLPLQNNSVGNWLEDARIQLKPVCISPAIEAQMIASHTLGKPTAWLLAHPEFLLDRPIIEKLNSILQSVKEGYPFAYYTGEREFYGRMMIVSPGLLVPRPETELLVEHAIRWLKNLTERRSAVDVGCGTGCIAVTLAAEIPDLLIDAIDVDALALQVTNQNAAKYNVQTQVAVFHGSLLGAGQRQYDLICANLPYIPSETVKVLPAARYEPVRALDGGPDGLRLIEVLLQQSVERLRSGGLILLEIEASQGKTAPALAQKYFPAATTMLYRDLAGLPRLVSIQTQSGI